MWVPTNQTAEDFYSGKIEIDLESIYHSIYVPNSPVGVNNISIAYPFGGVTVAIWRHYTAGDVGDTEEEEYWETEDINGKTLKSITEEVFDDQPLDETRVLTIWKANITNGVEGYNVFEYYWQCAIYKLVEEVQALDSFIGDVKIEIEWQLGFENLRLVRKIYEKELSNRLAMHSTDYIAEDAWKIEEGFSASITLGDMNWTEAIDDEEHTVGLIIDNDSDAFNSWGWSMAGSMIGSLTADKDDYFTITFNGYDLSILDAPAFDDQTDRVDAVGTKNTWTLIPKTFYTSPFGVSYTFGGAPAYCWGYNPTGDKFLEEDSFNPLIDDSFQDEDEDPLYINLQDLPEEYTDHVLVNMPNNRNELPVPKKTSHWLNPKIQYDWSVDNLYFVGDNNYNDNYISIYVPGINKKTNEDPIIENIITITREDDVAISFNSDNEWEYSSKINIVDGTISIEPTANEQYIYRELKTRYYDRMALMKQVPGNGKEWNNPWRFKAYGEGEGTLNEDEPSYAEDTYCWKDYGWLNINFEGDTWTETLTLEIGYTVPTVYDPHYTCGALRAEDYEVSYSSSVVTYNFEFNPSVNIDLLCPLEGIVPKLLIVDWIKISGWKNTAEETKDFSISSIELIKPPAQDNTGRDISGGISKNTTFKVFENYDFLNDWSSFNLYIDGCFNILNIPDHPHKGGIPEHGVRGIEPLYHCPTFTGLQTLLHTIAPLEQLSIIEYATEGFNIEYNYTNFDEATLYNDDGVYKRLFTTKLNMLANNIKRDIEEVGDTNGYIHVGKWGMVRGAKYKCYFNKVVGGSINGLVKTNYGRKRFTKQDCTDHKIIIWYYIHYYNEDDIEVGAPSGYPSSTWTQILYEDLEDYIDYEGVLEVDTTGFLQSNITLENEYTARIEYVGQIWNDDEIEDYDINDEDDLEDINNNASATFSFEIKNRHWTNLIYNANIKYCGAIDTDYGVQDGILLVKEGKYKYDTYLATDNIQKDIISRWTGIPEYDNNTGYKNFSPTCKIIDNGICLVGHSSISSSTVTINDSISRYMKDMINIPMLKNIRLASTGYNVVVAGISSITTNLEIYSIDYINNKYILEDKQTLGLYDYIKPAICYTKEGTGFIACSKDNNIDIYKGNNINFTLMKDITINLDKYSVVNITTNNINNYMVAYNVDTEMLDGFEIYKVDESYDVKLVESGIVECDEITPGLIYIPDGTMMLTYVVDGEINFLRSNNFGETWITF